jgi:hypothetical protein
MGAAWTVLVGPDAPGPDMVRLRAMRGGHEEDVPAVGLVDAVVARLMEGA